MIPQLLQKLTAAPWLILDGYHDTLVTIAKLQEPKTIAEIEAMAGSHSRDRKPYETTETAEGTVAHIYLHGPIIHRADIWDKWFWGAVSPQELQEVLTVAAQDTSVDAILLQIDSPGGTAIGTPELAAVVNEIDNELKPIVAHIDGHCCSGAYWVASQCSAIVANPSALVGCIGVYLAMLDQSGAYELEGYKREVIKNTAGVHKAAGYPGTSLTEEQRTALEVQMDEIFKDFVQTVTAARGDMPDDALNGFSYTTPVAVNINLIDQVNTPEAALALALELAE